MLNLGRRSAAIVTPVLLVLSCVACGDEEPKKDAAPFATPAAPSRGPQSTRLSIGPDAAAAYIAGLRAIDPGLVVNTERALRRGRDVCLDLEQGEFAGERLNARVAARLSGGNATITEAQAAQAIELAKAHICSKAS